MKPTLANPTLAQTLDQHTAPAASALVRTEGERIRCLACGHRCLIGAGQRGICKVRFNEAGRLKVPFGYVSGLQCDPVEKKPFFHVYPGSDALTFGMMGCDLHCSYCQNWVTSQALRDAAAVAPVRETTPAQLIEVAQKERARLIVSSYNEPLITAEWAVAVFEKAKAAGIDCAFVSNGNATPEVLDFLRPWIVAYKVDLKSFDDRNYRKLGGVLENITDTIRMVHELGIWLEVVTLIVPGFNDGTEELRQIARFLVGVSRDIPWHVSAFHKDYRMTDPDPTGADTLVRAAEIGAEEGLRFVYAGNLPGRAGLWENTRCPLCQTTVIERIGYLVRSYQLTADGCCPKCGARLPGVWPRSSAEVKTGNDPIAYQGRVPRVLPLERGAWTVDRGPKDDAPRPTVHAPRPTVADASGSQGQRFTLDAEQKTQLLTAVAGLLRSQVAGEPMDFPAELADVGNRVVSGAFVSLKLGRHLRSCCGMLGRPIPLHLALTHSAERTIWDDDRFPPVSPAELDRLEMEVWLLFAPEPVQARGQDRANAILIGTHGIQVVRGQSRGLFLPSVAVEYKWDAVTFLNRVCLKAGLPASAWLDDETALFTFEGDVLHAALADVEGTRGVRSTSPRGVGSTDLPALAAACRANLADLLDGRMPRYFFGTPDGMLNGLVLFVQRPGTDEVRNFSKLSLRPAFALQGTLFSLVQAAAEHLASQKITPQAFDTLTLGLTLLSDPQLHGTVADPHLDGFDPSQRALLVIERNQTGLTFEPSRTTEELLQAAVREARVKQPENAAIYSLAAISNVARVAVSTAPNPVRGPAVRSAAVAGSFYPSDPDKLSRTVDELLGTGDREQGTGNREQGTGNREQGTGNRDQGPKRSEHLPCSLFPVPCSLSGNEREIRNAVMVPHAGLRFSGRIAADVFKRIDIPRTVIVIGPNHTGRGMDWAVAPHQTWILPGMEVASDFILARRLCEAIAGLEMDATAHQYEHAIEVELPFIARLAPEAKVVGITIAHSDLDRCKRFAQGLAAVIRARADRTLLVISSDMNHFATDAENRRLDALALAALEGGDPKEVFDVVHRHHISMCGVLPAVIVLETLQLLGNFSGGQRVGYATSGDVTGDTSRVVGYAGMLFG